LAPPPQALPSCRSMKMATPQSLPEGVSASAGISVSTAAVMKGFQRGQRDEGLFLRWWWRGFGCCRLVRRDTLRTSRRNRGSGKTCAKQESSPRKSVLGHQNLPLPAEGLC
jgi:hypothetical protein